MIRRRLRIAAGVALVATLASGCQSVGRSVGMPLVQPPLAEMVAPPAFLTPRSQRYRLAVRPFEDSTGRASQVTGAAAEVLVTALHDDSRFSLFDLDDSSYDSSYDLYDSLHGARERGPGEPLAPASVAGVPGREGEAEARSRRRGAAAQRDVYAELQGIVDGVLESHVTAIRMDGERGGYFEVDYRVVEPYSRMVVTSGSARIGLAGGRIVRQDFATMAGDLGRRFIAPQLMALHEVAVSEVSLDGSEVKLTLDGGSAEQVERGYVGFVVEQDRHTRVDRYLAKFVVVNVFEEASVGVVVAHCNSVGRCEPGHAVVPVEQAQSVHVGSRVRFK